MEQFVGDVVDHTPTIAHIGDREVEQSSLDSAGGRDEELEEGEDEEEESSRGAATVDDPMEEMDGAIEETEGASTKEIERGTTAEASTVESRAMNAT